MHFLSISRRSLFSNIFPICVSHTQDYMLFGCPVCISRHYSRCSPNTSYYLKGIRLSNQCRSSPGTNVFLNIQITLPSENFIISDVTWNKLYIMPGIRKPEVFNTMVCVLMEAFHFCWEKAKQGGGWTQSQICCGRTSSCLIKER